MICRNSRTRLPYGSEIDTVLCWLCIHCQHYVCYSDICKCGLILYLWIWKIVKDKNDIVLKFSESTFCEI